MSYTSDLKLAHIHKHRLRQHIIPQVG